MIIRTTVRSTKDEEDRGRDFTVVAITEQQLFQSSAVRIFNFFDIVKIFNGIEYSIMKDMKYSLLGRDYKI